MKKTGRNYMKANVSAHYKEADKWKVPYEKWLKPIAKHDNTTKEIENSNNVLIKTDRLRKDKTLQDCDKFGVVNYDIHWNPVRLYSANGAY
ncbi:MAG: hypothetical protein R2809_10900 [Flavobacteriales bacterium]